MARARRPFAVWLLAAAFLLGDAVPALGHYPPNVDHRAAANCLVTTGAGSWLQAYVANMNSIPAPGSFTFSGGGAFFTPTGYSTTYSAQYLYFQVRATVRWQDSSFKPMYGPWLRALGQLGQATAWQTDVLTTSGWVRTGVNVIYNGPDTTRSDVSAIQLPGQGWYWVEARYYWGEIKNSAGQVVVNPIEHWEALGWKPCFL